MPKYHVTSTCSSRIIILKFSRGKLLLITLFKLLYKYFRNISTRPSNYFYSKKVSQRCGFLFWSSRVEWNGTAVSDISSTRRTYPWLLLVVRGLECSCAKSRRESGSGAGGRTTGRGAGAGTGAATGRGGDTARTTPLTPLLRLLIPLTPLIPLTQLTPFCGDTAVTTWSDTGDTGAFGSSSAKKIFILSNHRSHTRLTFCTSKLPIDACQTRVSRSSAAAIRGGKIPGEQNPLRVVRAAWRRASAWRASKIAWRAWGRPVLIYNGSERYR